MKGKMTGLQLIGVPVDFCMCGHWREDHDPKCIVIEDNIECICRSFSPKEEDDWAITLQMIRDTRYRGSSLI